jgi:tripartite ATP-independent transporter DctP family solute receptor
MTLTRKRFLRIAGSAAALAVAGPVLAQASGRRLKVANFYAADHAMNRALREVFVPKLTEYSKGALTASIHDNSSLGSEKELTEGVRLGAIEMGITGGLLAASLPKVGLLELPFVFRDFAHVWRALDGAVGQELAAEYDKAGIKMLAWVGNGFRAITNSVRPINTVADCKGIRMRMPENRIYVETGKALGFSVVTMPFGEVFNALSQKVVDGQDNPPPTVLASKWYEVQKHLAITNHIFSYGGISINKRLFDGMPVEQRQALQRAATETAVVQRQMLEKDSSDVVAKLQSLGMAVTRPNLDEFQRATDAVRAELAAKVDGGAELLKRIATA